MNKLLILFLAFTIQISTYAQRDTLSLVKVIGEYAIKVKPDYVVLGISIHRNLSANASDIKMAFRIFEKEDTRIRLFDFDDKDMTETFIHIDNSDKRPVYIKDVFITIKDMDKLDETLLELHRLGFTNYKYIDYRVLNLKALKDNVRTEALKSAKEKAVLLATTLGQTVGKAHTIEDLETSNYNWYTASNTNKRDSIGNALNVNDYLFDPGYIVILSRVKVSFDLDK